MQFFAILCSQFRFDSPEGFCVTDSLALCCLLRLLIHADAEDAEWGVPQTLLVAHLCSKNWPFLFLSFNWFLIQEGMFPSFLATFFFF